MSSMRLHNKKKRVDYGKIEILLGVIVAVSVIGLCIYIHNSLQNMDDIYASATKISNAESPKFGNTHKKSGSLATSHETDGNAIPGTYMYGGLPNPLLPGSFVLIHKETDPDEVDYVTAQTTNQVLQTISQVCASSKFVEDNSSNDGLIGHEINGSWYYSKAVKCSSSNGLKNWQFNIAPVSQLSLQAWKSQIPQSVLSGQSNVTWLAVFASGPPIPL
jgi:hypothetical protein